MTECFAGRIRRRVSLAVQPIDDFTDQPIVKSGIHVWIDGEPLPIRKTEGYYIFTDLCRKQAVLWIEGDGYEKRHVEVSLRENGADWQLLRPRLMPGRNHPLAGQTVRLRGTAKPGASIFGLWWEPLEQQTGGERPQRPGEERPQRLGGERPQRLREERPLRLDRDYARQEQEGETHGRIAIHGLTQRNLSGRMLYISDTRSGGGEFCHLLDEESCETVNGRYLISQPLSQDYPKVGCLLYPAYGTKADRNGTFFMAIPGREGESAYLLEARSPSGTVREVFRLKPGDYCVSLENQRGGNL